MDHAYAGKEEKHVRAGISVAGKECLYITYERCCGKQTAGILRVIKKEPQRSKTHDLKSVFAYQIKNRITLPFSHNSTGLLVEHLGKISC